MQTEDKYMMEYVNDKFKNGNFFIRLQHSPKDGEEVPLDMEKDLLPYTDSKVHLLSPYAYHERTMLYMVIEELIQLFGEIKKEQSMEPSLLSVLETLLMGLDFLTHIKLINTPFQENHKNRIHDILSECFEKQKQHSFSLNAERGHLNASEIVKKDGKIYALDKREDKTRIYMAVVYRKANNNMERFKQVGYLLRQVDLKPNSSHVEYEEMLAGKTDHELYSDLLFYLNMVIRTLCWLMNSASWRSNQLYPFDEMDIRCKLGLR
jgi:hypothetical protein